MVAAFGVSGDLPISGNWDGLPASLGQSGSPLVRALANTFPHSGDGQGNVLSGEAVSKHGGQGHLVSYHAKPTATQAPTHTATNTPTSAAAATNTPKATATSTPTPTATNPLTASRTPTRTPTATLTPSQTPSLTPTNTSTPTQLPPFTGATFIYDGDGRRVAQIINNVTTYFIGAHYEVTGSTVTKYYFAGSQRVAMRVNSTLSYLLSDHLGSTSLTTNSSGAMVSELRYKAWGETRYSSGTTPTKYQYTGQYSDSYINLLWYNSRHYDPELGRFIQPDSIVPDPSNSQSWDRYSYTFNNPIRFTDPDGHWPHCSEGVRCVSPIADKRDLTKWVVAAAVDIAESAEMQSVEVANSEFRKFDAKAEFESLTADGEKYDVKDKMLEEFKGDPIKIGNDWYEYSTAGNIIFGFYGKAAGWSDFELFLGAGKAQFDDWRRGEGELGPLVPPYYGDTMDDHFAVEFGIYLYENYYVDDGVLTTSDLLDAFEKYEYSDRMALETRPKVFQPRHYEYPVNRFYHME